MLDAAAQPAEAEDQPEFGKDAADLIGQADRLAMMIHQRKRRDFNAWMLIGKALATAKQQIVAHHGGSLRHPGRPWTAFLDRHPGLRAISESDRSSACWLWDNHADVIAWRGTLPEATREALCHPASNRMAFTRHVRLLTMGPKAQAAAKPDLRAHVVRLEKILLDLGQRHAALEAEVVSLRGRVAHLEAAAAGPMMRGRRGALSASPMAAE